VLSSRRNQLSYYHFSGHFILTTSLKQQMILKPFVLNTHSRYIPAAREDSEAIRSEYSLVGHFTQH
jgi:hypothetical protein